MTRHERTAKDIIEAEGLRILSLDHKRGGHMVFTVQLPEGDKVQRLFTGKTPSDKRWSRKFRCDARRLVRQLREEHDNQDS